MRIEISGRGLLIVLAVAAVVWALWQLWSLVLLVLASLILMAALAPAAGWLERRGAPRTLAVLGLLLALLLALAGMFATVAPAVYEEVQDLRANLPSYAADVEQLGHDLGFDTSDWELERRAHEIDWTEVISGRLALTYGQRVAYALFSTVTVLVLTAYLLMDAGRLRAFILRFVPASRHPDAEHFLRELSRVVGGYVRGQLVTSAVIGIYTTVVLTAVGVPNPLAFGILAAFADVIPLVGAFIAIVPATLAAFQESPTQAAVVLGLLLAYQQFEDRYLVPKVYSRTLNVPPLVVLLAVLVGAELLGIAGVLLALPAAAAGRVVLDYYWPPAQDVPSESLSKEAPAESREEVR